ncbi:MAG: hypothetical protein AABX65_03340 [Nanoarchaeota archaeon]
MAYSVLRKLGTYASAGLFTGLTALCFDISANEVKFKSSTKSLSRSYAPQEQSVNIGGKDFYVRETPKGYKIKLAAGDSSVAFQTFCLQAVAGTITEKVEKEISKTHKETFALARLHYADAEKKLKVVLNNEELEFVRIPLASSVIIPKDKLEEYQENNKKLELKTLTIDGKDFYVHPTAHFTAESLAEITRTGIANELLIQTIPSTFIPRTENLANGDIKMTEFLSGRVYALMPATLEEIKPETTNPKSTDAKVEVESGASEKEKK